MASEALSLVDKLLTVWILLAIGLGLGLSFIPGLSEGLNSSLQIGDGQNILLVIGLVVMMVPPLMKVNYHKFTSIATKNSAIMITSIVLNYIIGPLLMYFLGFGIEKGLCTASSNCYEIMEGIILIGVARCIAMVIVWVQYAEGDEDLCAILVAMNSALQLILYAVYAFILSNLLLPAMWGPTENSSMNYPDEGIALAHSFLIVLQNVAIYLGIPFLIALGSFFLLRPLVGESRYATICKVVSPATLIALLFTIVLMFAIKGETLLDSPLDVVFAAIPLILYFFIMFNGSFLLGWSMGMTYKECTTIAFTAAGNNFEVALAVAISYYGVKSPQALAAIVGPLIEIPVMMALIWISFAYRAALFSQDGEDPQGKATPSSPITAGETEGMGEGEEEGDEWIMCKACPKGDAECPAKILKKRALRGELAPRRTE